MCLITVGLRANCRDRIVGCEGWGCWGELLWGRSWGMRHDKECDGWVGADAHKAVS